MPLRPPPFFQLFTDPDFSLPPPPLPSAAAGSEPQPAILGVTDDPATGFVLPLARLGIEQMYDERCFDAAALGSADRPTPKGELKRLSGELRAHVQQVALALADEALGLGGGGGGGGGGSGAGAGRGAGAGSAAMAGDDDGDGEIVVALGEGAGGGAHGDGASASAEPRSL